MLEQLQVLILKMNYELWLQTNEIKKIKNILNPQNMQIYKKKAEDRNC